MLCWGSGRGLYRTEVELVKKKLNWTEVVFRRFINLFLVLVHRGLFFVVFGLVYFFGGKMGILMLYLMNLL